MFVPVGSSGVAAENAKIPHNNASQFPRKLDRRFSDHKAEAALCTLKLKNFDLLISFIYLPITNIPVS